MRQLLAAIERELARAEKHRAVYRAAGTTGAVARLTRRMRMLERLRAETAVRVDPTARIIDDDADSVPAPNTVVLPPNGRASTVVSSPKRSALASIEFPAMTAGAMDEDDLLDGLV
jgi:hypothetical protein